eukprot:CAMPEP_0168615192 /NCGR_PEP_ID=MMETSP0449_2-20121227/4376_1 /TAXON_ID=1082188 /ORGANISM="Strombidium rassoulzadegani, Strain ras09" /LENGTH=118 /DNA_ID=CAMNT_0008655921 /DNA_START=235 /DNA_END=590 /DNA_ORIENTATION=+
MATKASSSSLSSLPISLWTSRSAILALKAAVLKVARVLGVNFCYDFVHLLLQHLDLHVVQHRLHLVTLYLAAVTVLVELLESLVALVLDVADQLDLALGDDYLVRVFVAVGHLNCDEI